MNDSVIGQLLGKGYRESILRRKDSFDTPQARGLRAHILLRSRYAEDRLQTAASSGMPQALFLGAGLDTYAYRQPSASGTMKIFEIDHPSTQAEKLRLLENAGISLPDNLAFVPVDFETMDLKTELAKAGFEEKKPAFIVWLGITVYLSHPAIDATLGFAASMAKGSRLALSFTEPDSDAGTAAARSAFAKRAESVGEPWITFFTPQEMETRLRGCGFSEVLPLAADEAEGIFAGRSDGLAVPRSLGLVTAVV